VESDSSKVKKHHCGICKHPIRVPQVCKECTGEFCKVCIANFMLDFDMCPGCQAVSSFVEEIAPDPVEGKILLNVPKSGYATEE